MTDTEQLTEIAENLADAPEDAVNALPDLLAELTRLRTRNEALEREHHRWLHGAQVEGDYVCAAELELINGMARREALERVAEAARYFGHNTNPGDLDRDRLADAMDALAALDGVDRG